MGVLSQEPQCPYLVWLLLCPHPEFGGDWKCQKPTVQEEPRKPGAMKPGSFPDCVASDLGPSAHTPHFSACTAPSPETRPHLGWRSQVQGSRGIRLWRIGERSSFLSF